MRILQRTPTLGLPILGILALFASTASATMMAPQTTEQLYHAATVVALVNVKDVSSVQTKGRITTHVQIEVSRLFKTADGVAEGSTIEVLAPGGAAGRYTQQVLGAPRFVQGESAVVFLSRVTDGVYQVVSLEQGKFTLETSASGERIVHRYLTSAYARRTDRGLVEAEPPAAVEPLDSFMSTLTNLSGVGR